MESRDLVIKTNTWAGFSTFLPWLQSRSFIKAQQINPHLSNKNTIIFNY